MYNYRETERMFMGSSNLLSSYRKKNVDAYIIDLNKQHQDALNAKDAEIEALNKKYIELQGKFANLSADVIELQKDKSRVANVLLEAETAASAMLEQARGDAEKEKTELLAQLEQLREEVIDRKRLIQTLKDETAAAIEGMKAKLDEAAQLAQGSFEDLNNRYPEA
jgi:chromosome segregation ATPase